MLVSSFKKYCWPLIFAVFIISRLFAFSGFAPHNDEIIYTEYAQLINSNWEKYWDVSMGTMYSDYKDPLQYWLTSLTVNLFEDPLLGVRFVSLIFSFLAFYFFIKLIRKRIGETGAIISALLWVGSTFYFYFDILGLAEVYIYTIVLLLLYSIDYLGEKYSLRTARSWILIIGITFLFLCGLLFKQTMLVIVPAILLAPFLWQPRHKVRYYISGIVLLSFFTAKLLYNLIIGNTYSDARNNSSGLISNTFSLSELSNFPVGEWMSNVKFYFFDIISSDYLLVFGLSISFVLLIISILHKRGLHWLKRYGFLFLFWILSILPTIIFLKPHNARHYGIYLYILFLIIAMSYKDLLQYIKNRKYRVVLFIATGLFFVTQLGTSIVDLSHFEATDLSQIEIGDSWASPLGINELINRMQGLDSGVVLFLSYWGHPATTMKVYRHLFPQLLLMPLVDVREGQIRVLADELNKDKRNLYIIFDKENDNDTSSLVQTIFNNEFLCGKRDVIPKVYKETVYQNTALVICYTGKNK